MDEREIDIIKHELGLNAITDPAELQVVVKARLANMNAIERAEVQMRIGRKLSEADAKLPGGIYSPATWSLVATSLFFFAIATLAIFIVRRSDGATTARLLGGIVASFALLLGFVALSRALRRLATKRDL